MRHSGVARRIRAQSPVMRAIGCSTNSRQEASTPFSVSGGVAGFSCRARTAPWAYPSARVESVSAFSRPSRCSGASMVRPHQRQVCRPIRQMPVLLAINCGSVSSPNAFNSATNATTSGSNASIGGNSGILAPDGFGAVPAGFHIRWPRVVVREERGQHDERERVGILIAAEHVTNERAFGLVQAGGS